MAPLSLFIYLQLLDFLTTVLFLKLGVLEGNWMVRVLMRWSPILGVLAAKVATIVLASLAVRFRKDRLMRLANLGYSGVVAWNMIVMILARPA
jgi:hypothetical protein